MALVVKKLKPAFLTFLSFSVVVATHRTYFSLRFQPFNRRREPSNHSVLLKSLNCEDQKRSKKKEKLQKKEKFFKCFESKKNLGDRIWITVKKQHKSYSRKNEDLRGKIFSYENRQKP